MVRTRPEHESTASDASAGEGVGGVRRAEAGRGVSSTSAARTRTLGGETVEFQAVDYRPPQGVRTTTDTRPEAVAPAGDARLGRAAGVASLRLAGASPTRASAGKEPLTQRTKAVIAAVLVVVAAAVFAGGYLGFSAVFGSLNSSVIEASSAIYATDAYSLFAVEGDDGALQDVYLAYVDSIDERVELCHLVPGTYCGTGSDGSALDLASVYAQGGLASLLETVADLAGVEVVAAVSVSPDEMAQVLALGGTQGEAASLAAQVWDEDQQVTETALRGLLNTMADVSDENHLVLEAPAEEAEVADGTTMTVLDDALWTSMVLGMRDATQAVSPTS